MIRSPPFVRSPVRLLDIFSLPSSPSLVLSIQPSVQYNIYNPNHTHTYITSSLRTHVRTFKRWLSSFFFGRLAMMLVLSHDFYSLCSTTIDSYLTSHRNTSRVPLFDATSRPAHSHVYAQHYNQSLTHQNAKRARGTLAIK